MLNIIQAIPATADAVRAPDFKRGVAAAVRAFAKTGRMLDAALAYQKWGIPVFPLTAGSKTPIPRRDPDPTGKFPNGIPGTGGHLKATTDVEQIMAWWTENPRALIGVPCGPRSGIWALDPDTTEDHDHDGVGAWHALLARHGAVNTREHRTATNGLHVIFKWNEARPVSSKGHMLPPGVDVKINGYIVTAPGKRKGRNYVVACDVDPAEAPEWLYALLPGRPSRSVTSAEGNPAKPKTVWHDVGNGPSGRVVLPRSEMPKFASALDAVPNPDLEYDSWIAYILAIWASTDGSAEGYELAERWSKKSTKFGKKENFRERWFVTIAGSPPTDTGPNKIYAAAIEQGWEWQPDEPSAVANVVSLADAREALQRDMERLVNYDKRVRNAYELFAEEMLGPIVRVIGKPVTTGVGKSHAAMNALAKFNKRFLYTVPTIKLGGLGREIKQKFSDLGVDVELFLGRGADDPEHDGQKMCLDLDAVNAAVKAMQSVQTTCCKSREHECPFYTSCGYQRQLKRKPQGWIAASDMLFHWHRVFKNVEIIIIDEAFVEKSLRGIAKDRVQLPIAVLSESNIVSRHLLGRRLLTQATEGGLQRATIVGDNPDDPLLDDEFLYRLKRSEWDRFKTLSKQLKQLPGSSSRTQKQARARLIDDIVATRHIITLVNEIQNTIDHEIETSGRLEIETISGVKHIKWRGQAPISKRFQNLPIIYLDATMPSKEILKTLLPTIEIKSDRQVAMPEHVETFQFRKAATSADKLIHGEHIEGHRQDIKLYTLKRWMEFDCQPTLVIAQKPVADWLRTQNLPDNIGIEHYNAVAGIDKYKHVRLHILVGRVQPGPDAIEAQAATLSGKMPDVINGRWYPSEPVGIQLRNGRLRMVQADRHPDPFCEANRTLITEGELQQAYGRSRPLLRDENSPLTIDMLFDNPLPGVIADKVLTWKAPSRFIETAYSDGVMLLSPVDMVRLWPTIWATLITARRDVAAGAPTLPGFALITYRPKAPKAKRRAGYFHTVRVPDPARWLEDRLGVPVESRHDRRPQRLLPLKGK